MKLHADKVLFVFLAILLLFLIGCDIFFNEKEARRKILSEDPSFLEVLEKKEEIDRKIAKLKTQLSSEEKILNAEIEKLRSEFNEEKRKIDLELKNLNNNIDKYRQEIKTEINHLSSRLSSKEKILKNTDSTIEEATRLLSKDSEAGFSLAERHKWNQQLHNLKVQKKQIQQDINLLEKKLNIEKLKLKLLK
jgi:chromosome segregation ATPase